MSRLHLTCEARQPRAHASTLGHAAANTRRNATGGTVALALVPERPLPTQAADGSRTADYQMGRGCFE